MRNKSNKLSIVVPCFNEEKNITKFHKETSSVLDKARINHEFIFVNDGSSDNTWKKIRVVSKRDDSVKGISFSRNFGKEAAISAGLAESTGRCVVVIDSDLQQPPEKIPEMFELWLQGFDVVEGCKKSRGKESFVHKKLAGLFYGIISKSTGVDMSRASDFKLLDKKVVRCLLEFPERNSFFRALSSWIGFNSTEVEYDVQERYAGSSKWSLVDLTKYALTNIVAFTDAPLQFITILGVIILLLSLILTIKTVVDFLSGNGLGGFTTVICLLGLIGSTLMISLGIIGYYLSKIYEEVKSRPKYIIAKHTKVNRK